MSITATAGLPSGRTATVQVGLNETVDPVDSLNHRAQTAHGKHLDPKPVKFRSPKILKPRRFRRSGFRV